MRELDAGQPRTVCGMRLLDSGCGTGMRNAGSESGSRISYAAWKTRIADSASWLSRMQFPHLLLRLRFVDDFFDFAQKLRTIVRNAVFDHPLWPECADFLAIADR